MELEYKLEWEFLDISIRIDPYRQIIHHDSGTQRHSDAWGRIEALKMYGSHTNGIKQFIEQNSSLKPFQSEITRSIEYYSSDSYLQANDTIFNLSDSYRVNGHAYLQRFEKQRKMIILFYVIFIIFLNGGIYLSSMLNERIQYFFIVSILLCLLIVYDIISRIRYSPKIGVGQIIDYAAGTAQVIAGKHVPSTSYFLVLGQQSLYSLQGKGVSKKDCKLEFNTRYQVSKSLYDQHRTSGNIVFITSNDNEILEIVDVFR